MAELGLELRAAWAHLSKATYTHCFLLLCGISQKSLFLIFRRLKNVIAFRKVKKKKKNIVGKFRLEQNCGHSTIIDWYLIYGALASAWEEKDNYDLLFFFFFLSILLCCSVTRFCLTLCDPLDCSVPGFLVLHYLPEFAQTHCPLSWWCHSIISSSTAHFSSCLQSFPASGSFPVSELFASGGQSMGLQHQSFQWIFSVDFL